VEADLGRGGHGRDAEKEPLPEQTKEGMIATGMSAGENAMDEEVGQREETVRLLRWLQDQPEPEAVQLLDQLVSTDALKLLLGLPFGVSFSIDCKLPKNEHTVSVAKAYFCSANAAHKFCLKHNLQNMKCPICGSVVTIR